MQLSVSLCQETFIHMKQALKYVITWVRIAYHIFPLMFLRKCRHIFRWDYSYCPEALISMHVQCIHSIDIGQQCIFTIIITKYRLKAANVPRAWCGDCHYNAYQFGDCEILLNKDKQNAASCDTSTECFFQNTENIIWHPGLFCLQINSTNPQTQTRTHVYCCKGIVALSSNLIHSGMQNVICESMHSREFLHSCMQNAWNFALFACNIMCTQINIWVKNYIWSANVIFELLCRSLGKGKINCL